MDIRQAGSSFVLRPGVGALYYANEPYELRCDVKSRQFWIELPREAFDRRFDSGRPPLLKHLDLGPRPWPYRRSNFAPPWPPRAAISTRPEGEARRAVHGHPGAGAERRTRRQPADEQSVQRARLRSVKAYIEANLGDPNLSLTTIARRMAFRCAISIICSG